MVSATSGPLFSHTLPGPVIHPSGGRQAGDFAFPLLPAGNQTPPLMMGCSPGLILNREPLSYNIGFPTSSPFVCGWSGRGYNRPAFAKISFK
jgi:hypothetical protein